jgi:acetoacetate decarboxylase
VSFPPPPWQLEGELTIVPARVRPADARRFHVPPGVRLLGLGGVMLADYRAGTLRYSELVVFSALTTRGFVVSHIYVDSEQSLRGGHAVWGLPKELAEFELTPRTFTARQGDQVLLRARIRRRAGRFPLWIPAPTVGDVGGAAVSAVGRARIRAAPALVTLDVPGDSPFAALGLGLAGTRPALAGDRLRLTMPAPGSPCPPRRAGGPRRSASPRRGRVQRSET